MNTKFVADIGFICLYLICVIGLFRELVKLSRTAIQALQNQTSTTAEGQSMPSLRAIFLWLASIWVPYAVRFLIERDFATQVLYAELLGLGLLSRSVLIKFTFVSRLRRRLNEGLFFDPTTWNLLLRISLALLIVGAATLCIFLVPGVDLQLESLLHYKASIPVMFLQLLGVSTLILVALLGLISNGWIKYRLGLGSPTIHLRISPIKAERSDPEQPNDMDLETEYFFHIRNLEHENNQ
ncbi:MAG: hypothetical protein P8Y12_06510 [Gammaproteobacteria bacterium]